jgi:uncharacterized metal-binding protein YceD (DUF177 family)
VTDSPQFFVPVADLDYGDRELDEEIPVEWLKTALSGTEATPDGAPGRLKVVLSKNGREVMVRGRARAKVTMPCSRTLEPVPITLDAEIFLLLSPKSADRPHAKKRSEPSKKPAKGPKGPKSKARSEPEDPLTDEAAATDTHDGEKIVLDAYLREFLVLELPMVPLREDLRSEATPAIERPPNGPAQEGGTAEATIDPRLAPLLSLKSRLREKKE